MCFVISDYADVLRAPMLQEWLRNSHSHLNTDQQNPQIYAFTLRILALLTENEWQFMNLMETDICSRLV